MVCTTTVDCMQLIISCRLHEIIEIDIFKDIVYDKQYGSALVCHLISNVSPEPFESC